MEQRKNSAGASPEDFKAKQSLLRKLEQLYQGMLQAEAQKSAQIETVNSYYKSSAINLIDYLALRSQDIEALQKELHQQGLSSLSASESHIRLQLIRVMKLLNDEKFAGSKTDAESGTKQLQQNCLMLLGQGSAEGLPPVMVTFDTNFAADTKLISSLLENGMRIARINCAHDDEETWAKMISSLQKAMAKTMLPCKLYMDLAGPKIRTQISSKKHKKGKLKVALGDKVILIDSDEKGQKGEKTICCTLPGIVKNLKAGERVFFDDGLFEAVVQHTSGNQAKLKITRISAKKSAIKSEKGINFPDTFFQVNPVTDFDRQCLPFIVKHASMVGFSFVKSAADMQELQNQLALLNRPDFPIIAKIETSQSVDQLPEIILQGMQQEPIGIMVARGDMALEVGFERMSEVQDELLWICEAAHTPVIWATQVLESLNKQGLPTRGEITDAAHAAAADCVMINKGGHVVEVLKTLSCILDRSRRNNYKNRRLFRKLSITSNFFS